MLVCVCGNGFSGSSAVTDYLRGCPDVGTTKDDIEFCFLTDVDGIDDLRHHLVERPVRFFSSDAAIKRFRRYIKKLHTPRSFLRKTAGKKIIGLTDSYLKDLTQLSWRGWWHFDVSNSSFWTKNYYFRFRTKLNVLLRKTIGKSINIYPNGIMSLSVKPNCFDNRTKEYIEDIIDLLNTDKKTIFVLDQPFPPGEQDYYSRYFSQTIKTINVIRDPRDLYILCKCINKGFASWIPTDNVDDFIKYFKIINSFNKENNDRSITIFFEEMIYDYEMTTRKIKDFVSISNSSWHSNFNPSISINNTQLFLKYPSLKEDVIKIENELKEYLFDFTKYQEKPSSNGKAF